MYNPQDYQKKKKQVRTLKRTVMAMTAALALTTTLCILNIRECNRAAELTKATQQQLKDKEEECQFLYVQMEQIANGEWFADILPDEY